MGLGFSGYVYCLVRNMNELYLILHKVRNEPAFDIATRCDDMGTESDPGPWWIIPTSGHRAYPFAEWQLNELFWAPTTSDPKIPITAASESIMMKDHSAWPDHYAPSAAPRGTGLISNLAERLGLITKPKVSRR